jgi:dTDP-4-amino-4,6-dideoxy-D-galactose acyltransferase
MSPQEAAPSCRLLPWDSEFFGVRVARLETETGAAAMPAVFDWCATAGVDCLYYLVPSAGLESLRAAEEHGFRLVDIRVTFDGILSRMPPQAPGSTIRPAQPGDIESLAALARVSHHDTRFYSDPRFPREKCDSLYETWLRKSMAGWAQAVFVAGDEQGPAGYCTAHKNEDGAGSIGLIAVDPRAQGRGWGPLLLGATLGWFRTEGISRVRVVTQGRNIPAQRLYQRAGFRTCSVEVWYHRWFR